jgi:hypothetical protein
VELLVQGLELEKIRRHQGGGSGPFSLPRDSWGIIGTTGDGVLLDIEAVCSNIMLNDRGSYFKIGVCNLPRGVQEGNQVFCDIRIKMSPPENGTSAIGVDDLAALLTGRSRRWVEAGNQTPPMPMLLASWVLRSSGSG